MHTVLIVGGWLVYGLPLLVALAFGLRKRAHPLVVAVAWQALWALPAALYQLVWFAAKHGTGTEVFGMAPIAWGVQLGGASVTEVFEATAQSLTGHRQSTWLDNWHVFYAYTLIQVALLCAPIAWIYRSRKKLASTPMILCGLVVAGNSFANVYWPWWGS